MTHTLTLTRSPLQAALPPIGSPASGETLEGGGRPSLTFETEVPLSFETSLSREATPARPRAAEPRGRARAEPWGEGSAEPMAQADLDGAAVRVQAHQRGRVVRRGLGPAAARPPAAGGSKHAADPFDGGREEADLDGATERGHAPSAATSALPPAASALVEIEEEARPPRSAPYPNPNPYF